MAPLVVHFEIYASEPQRLIDFYSGLLGWEFHQMESMDYWTIDTGEGSIGMAEPGHGINGGLARRQGPPPGPGAAVNGANIVVGTDQVDAIFARGLELGATAAMELDDVPGVGRLGYLNDPDGNLFGLISPVLSDGTNVMENNPVA